MYERFTEGARIAIKAASSIAQGMNHEYIGTEHILLGLLEDGDRLAFHILQSWCKDNDKSLHAITVEVKNALQPGPIMVTMGKLPHTPRAKKVIEYAIEEARKHNHNYVGPEHLLLGLVREGDGIAGQVLNKNGFTYEVADEYLVELIGTIKKPDLDTAKKLIQEVIKAVEEDCPKDTVIFLAKKAVASLE